MSYINTPSTTETIRIESCKILETREEVQACLDQLSIDVHNENILLSGLFVSLILLILAGFYMFTKL